LNSRNTDHSSDAASPRLAASLLMRYITIVEGSGIKVSVRITYAIFLRDARTSRMDP